MVDYIKYKLANGLTVILHEDTSTPLVAVNILYKVGSRDEHPMRTGFTHLFEHLMFSGTPSVPNFDDPIQLAGGENNAFTNSDFTNFYDVVPAENLEVALWLEADRLSNIDITSKALNTQKKVVIEEFKETCLNEPYGDMWHHISDMVYSKHPYNWPTIGKSFEHIQNANLNHVKDFLHRHYNPQNAVLAICGPIDVEKVKVMISAYFGHIENKSAFESENFDFPDSEIKEPIKLISTSVPALAYILAFRMSDRISKEYYITDLISDVLSSGRSSRLYQVLIKEKELCSSIDAYISGTFDEGVFIIDAKANDGINLDAIRDAIWHELEQLKLGNLEEVELQKIKNKAESSLVFSETSVLNKAMSLCYYEYLGDIGLINEEYNLYQKISVQDMTSLSQRLFTKENAKEVVYIPSNEDSKQSVHLDTV